VAGDPLHGTIAVGLLKHGLLATRCSSLATRFDDSIAVAPLKLLGQ
jgi:hypothetical protein